MTEVVHEKTPWAQGGNERYWNHESQHRERYFSARHGDAIRKWVHRTIYPPARLIDLGAGIGALTEALLPMGYQVAAAETNDLSRKQIELRLRADRRYLGSVRLDEISSLGEGWDGALAIELIEHLELDQAHKLLELVSASLRPGGVLLISCPNDECLADSELCCPSCGAVFHKWQHRSSWSQLSLAAFLRVHGFELLSIECCDWDTEDLSALPRVLTRIAQRFSTKASADLRAIATKPMR